MKILIDCDHSGVELKNQLASKLREKYEVIESTVPHSPTDDYPDFVFDLEKKMDKSTDYLILICSNGIGISIAANKVKGIYCARVHSLKDVTAAKSHNRVNSISFAASTPLDDALAYIEELLSASYSEEERHIRRVNKIIKYENGEYNEI